MKSSVNGDAAMPGQVERKERDASSQGKTIAVRDGVSPSRESRPRRSNRQVELNRGSTPSSLIPSVLEYARRTQVDAQAHRTSVRMAELEKRAQDEETMQDTSKFRRSNLLSVPIQAPLRGRM